MIPITFNADDTQNVKKGHVRGQDLASFLSISMPKRAGILDIFSNPCGGNVSITQGSTYATIVMNKGYVNIYGRCIYVEDNEQVVVSLPTVGTVRGKIGIRIDLAESGANEVVWFSTTGELRLDNLLNNETTGVYDFEIFSYEATPNSLTITKTAPIIENIKDYLAGANFDTLPVTDNSKKIATTEFVGNKITNHLGFSKQSYSNTYVEEGKTKTHYFTIIDLLGVRVIYGTLQVLPANQNVNISWGQPRLNSANLDKAVFIPSFTTQTRGDDRGMDEPCHIKGVSTSGFTIYNSNGFTVTGTYLVIGQPV